MQNPSIEKKSKSLKLPTFGLRFLLSFICFSTILISGGIITYKTLNAMYSSSLRDATAILYLDLEQHSGNLAKDISGNAEKAAKNPPTAEYLLAAAGHVKWLAGPWQTFTTLEELGLDEAQLAAISGVSILVTTIEGDAFVAKSSLTPKGQVISFYRTNLSDMLEVFKINTKETAVYLANSSGRLVYTNTPVLTPANLLGRPLVMAFMKSPFRQGQLEFEINHQTYYGFHREVDNTNLVLFAEKSKKRSLASVITATKSVVKIVVVILIAAILLLQIPLTLLTKPIAELSAVATELAKGNFGVPVRVHGSGEFRVLTTAFVSMIASLNERNQTITGLADQKVKRLQLESELAVARTIQDRFIFKTTPPRDAGIRIAAKYIPASQVAGDWYGIHFDPVRNETTVAIIDITGHGIGSAMMTPVVSLLFNQSCHSGESFDLCDYLACCNAAMYTYGSGSCTGTGIVIKYSAKDRTLSWANAAHPQPLIVSSQKPKGNLNALQNNSNLLGIEKTLVPSLVLREVSQGDMFLIFSDGLIQSGESFSAAQKYSRKQISVLLNKFSSEAPDSVMKKLVDEWKSKVGGESGEDDMCAVIGVLS